jgi:hypothetical protein
MVLDNEGVSKAATDRAMYVRLKVAYEEGHRVVPHLTKLVAGRTGIAVAHVSKLGSAH